MDRDRSARIMRRRDRSLDLFEAQRRTAFLAGTPAIIGIELYPVRPGGDLASHRRHDGIDTGNFLGTWGTDMPGSNPLGP